MLNDYFLMGAVLVAGVAGVHDLRSARIPNWLTYSGAFAALAFRSTLLGWTGLASGIMGLLIAGIFFFVLFVMGAFGGGDVKLMACVGAWVGSNQIVFVLIAAALAGGCLAVFYTVFRNGICRTVSNILQLVQFHLSSGLRAHPLLNVQESGAARVPFGVAVAVATLICAANAIWWR